MSECIDSNRYPNEEKIMLLQQEVASDPIEIEQMWHCGVYHLQQ